MPATSDTAPPLQTNALIQGQGTPTGLVTSEGFRDLLEIGRQRRPELYDLQADKPRVLVSRDLRLEIPERVRHDGHRRHLKAIQR